MTLCLMSSASLSWPSRMAPGVAVTEITQYLGSWVFVNTNVSVDITYTGEEGSTQRNIARVIPGVMGVCKHEGDCEYRIQW
jgi:hypothetical protein